MDGLVQSLLNDLGLNVYHADRLLHRWYTLVVVPFFSEFSKWLTLKEHV